MCEKCLAIAVLDLALQDYHIDINREKRLKKPNNGKEKVLSNNLKKDKEPNAYDVFNKHKATVFIESDLPDHAYIRKLWCRIAGIDEQIFRERAKHYVKQLNKDVVCPQNTTRRDDSYDYV